MPNNELSEIAENAAFIVNGYAFNLNDRGFVCITNLEHPDCSMMVSKECELLATNMDAIEQKIVLDLCRRNMQFMEA